jgi:hypothetical protein
LPGFNAVAATVTIFTDAVALALHREVAIGVTEGHAEVLKAIANFITLHEPRA